MESDFTFLMPVPEAAILKADKAASQCMKSEAETRYIIDLGLIRDDSIVDYADLPDPIESGEEAIAQLEEAVDLLMSVVRELKSLERPEV